MNKLKELRLRANMTQTKLAVMSGVSLTVIKDAEGGRATPRQETIHRLAVGLRSTGLLGTTVSKIEGELVAWRLEARV